jgi:hypothetical protein
LKKGIKLKGLKSPVVLMKMTKNSNSLLVAEKNCTISVWNPFTGKLLNRIYSPLFELNILFKDMQKSEDPLSYLHKKQVKLQEPLGLCCSTENEDFLVYSKTNMAVHNINGVLLSGLRIKYGQPRISKASIIDVIFYFFCAKNSLESIEV